MLERNYKINDNVCWEIISPHHYMLEEWDWKDKGEKTSWEDYANSEENCIDYVLLNWFYTKMIREREQELLSIGKIAKKERKKKSTYYYSSWTSLHDHIYYKYLEVRERQHWFKKKNECLQEMQGGGHSS